MTNQNEAGPISLTRLAGQSPWADSIAPRIPPDQPLSAELWKGSLGSSLVGWIRSIGEAGKEAGISDKGRDQRSRVASKSLGRVASTSLGRTFCTPRGTTIARSPTLSIGGSIDRQPSLGTQKLDPLGRPAPLHRWLHRWIVFFWKAKLALQLLVFAASNGGSIGRLRARSTPKSEMHRSPSTSPTVAPSVECSFWRYTEKGWCQNRSVAQKLVSPKHPSTRGEGNCKKKCVFCVTVVKSWVFGDRAIRNLELKNNTLKSQILVGICSKNK